MTLALSNLQQVYNDNIIAHEVGCSFLYSYVGSWMWNGGDTSEALNVGGACALITFTASLLSPVVSGFFGYSHREPIIEPKVRILIQAGVLSAAALAMRIFFEIFINPVVMVVSIIANAVISACVQRVEAGHPYTIMHPLGFIGSIIQKNVNFEYVFRNFSGQTSRRL